MTAQNSIANYTIKRIIGEGGMGKVYLATHNKIDRKVAIKELHAHLSKNKDLRERFKNEAALMANLHHANIVTLHDYIETPQTVYLIMEYVEGVALNEYIENISGPIPEEKAIEMFVQILDAFEYAHERMIIHRDIKPSNLMMSKNGRIKILDFGIAKLVNAPESQLTKAGLKIGTIYYMSPEQVKAQELDTRSDIYSLGVTLFEMLTAQNPYAGNQSEFDISNKIVNEPLPRAKNIYPNISEQIQKVIDKATAKNPNDRYQSAEEFKEALLNRKDIELTQSPKGITVEWVLPPRAIQENRNSKENTNVFAQTQVPIRREREFLVFNGDFGRITNRRVHYLKGKDLFEKGKKEEVYLRKIASAQLLSHQEIGSALFFVFSAALLLIFYFNILTVCVAICLLVFAVICCLPFPTILMLKTDSKKIKMRAWPWHFRKASEFVHVLQDELLRLKHLGLH